MSQAAKAVVAGVAAALAQNTRDLARQQRLLATGSSIHRGVGKAGRPAATS